MHRGRLCEENADFSKMLIVLMDFMAHRDRVDVHIKPLGISLLESNIIASVLNVPGKAHMEAFR